MNDLLRKIPLFYLISWCRPKLCGNCAFPQNFHTRKLGEITVFYGVIPVSTNLHLYQSGLRPGESCFHQLSINYAIYKFSFFPFFNMQINIKSHRRCSVRKNVLKNFAKFTGKHLCPRLFFNKVAGPMLTCLCALLFMLKQLG